MKKALILFAASLGTTLFADVAVWPSKTLWDANPLYASAGVVYGDPEHDMSNKGNLHLDYVGNSTYAAGYLLYRSAAATPGETEDHLLLRLRMNADRNNNIGVYQILFETTGNDSVDWALQLVVTKSGNQYLNNLTFSTASGTNRNGVTFGSTVWQSTTAGYVNYAGATGDGSNFGGNPDYFLDLAMPWATFSANTGIASTNDPFRVVLGSATAANLRLNGDIGNTSALPGVDVNFRDVYGTSNPAAIPEPMVAGFISLFGIGLLAVKRLFKK